MAVLAHKHSFPHSETTAAVATIHHLLNARQLLKTLYVLPYLILTDTMY